MRFGITEHGVARTAKGEETHGSGNADIDTHHARFNPIFEFPGSTTAGCIKTGSIGVVPGIDQIDNIVQVFTTHDAHYRPEDFLGGDGHIGGNIIENRRSHKKAVGALIDDKIPSVHNQISSLFDSFFNEIRAPVLCGPH